MRVYFKYNKNTDETSLSGDEEALKLFEVESITNNEEEVLLKSIGHDFVTEEIHGEWIGLAKFSTNGSKIIHNEIVEMQKDGTAQYATMIELFERLIKKQESIHTIYISGNWLDIDNANDLADAQKFL